MSQRKKKNQLSKRERQRAGVPRSFSSSLLPRDATIIPAPADQVRMSEVILELIQPFEWTDLEDLKKLVGLATLAWNLANTSASFREETLAKMALELPADIRPVIREHIEELIDRKHRLFADNRRTIIEYDVTLTANGPHVSVISTFPPDAKR